MMIHALMIGLGGVGVLCMRLYSTLVLLAHRHSVARLEKDRARINLTLMGLRESVGHRLLSLEDKELPSDSMKEAMLHDIEKSIKRRLSLFV